MKMFRKFIEANIYYIARIHTTSVLSEFIPREEDIPVYCCLYGKMTITLMNKALCTLEIPNVSKSNSDFVDLPNTCEFPKETTVEKVKGRVLTVKSNCVWIQI